MLARAIDGKKRFLSAGSGPRRFPHARRSGLAAFYPLHAIHCKASCLKQEITNKEETMKRQLCALALSAALACAALYAQGATLEADVPFNFAVGDKEMPAAKYRVSYSSGVVTVRDVDGKRAAMALTKPAVSDRTFRQRKQGDSVLLFQRYGDEYFLSGVAGPSAPEGRMLPVGVRQKELASRMTGSGVTTMASRK
jgi:hypothetical protein